MLPVEWFPDQLILTTGKHASLLWINLAEYFSFILFFTSCMDKKIIDLGRKSGKMLTAVFTAICRR
jgi:hypothetical protein